MLQIRQGIGIPDFQAVAAGQTAIANIPLGLTYHKLMIGYVVNAVEATEADFIDDFEDIRIKKDGRTIWQMSGAEALSMNKYYVRPDEAGVLTIHFVKPESMTASGEDIMAWGTSEGVQQLTLEIDIKVGTVAPALDLDAFRTAPGQPWGRHLEVRRVTDNIPAIGDFQIQGWPTKGQRSIRAIHFNGGTVSRVKVQVDQISVFDLATKKAKSDSNLSGRAWQAGYWHLDYGVRDRALDVLPMAGISEHLMTLTAGAAGALVGIIESIEEPTS